MNPPALAPGGDSGNVGVVTLNNNTLDPELLPLGISLDAGETIVFTDTITGADASRGSLDFASFQLTGITPVPEPVACALPLFGLIFLGGAAGRFNLARRRT